MDTISAAADPTIGRSAAKQLVCLEAPPLSPLLLPRCLSELQHDDYLIDLPLKKDSMMFLNLVRQDR
jgi:hypothetical protein